MSTKIELQLVSTGENKETEKYALLRRRKTTQDTREEYLEGKGFYGLRYNPTHDLIDEKIDYRSVGYTIGNYI